MQGSIGHLVLRIPCVSLHQSSFALQNGMRVAMCALVISSCESNASPVESWLVLLCRIVLLFRNRSLPPPPNLPCHPPPPFRLFCSKQPPDSEGHADNQEPSPNVLVPLGALLQLQNPPPTVRETRERVGENYAFCSCIETQNLPAMLMLFSFLPEHGILCKIGYFSPEEVCLFTWQIR